MGAGCGPLARLMMERCASKATVSCRSTRRRCLLCCPEAPRDRVPGRFPDECGELLTSSRPARLRSRLRRAVVCLRGGNVFEFVDRRLELLAPGGQLLLGDLPNVSKRKRFFASEAGRRFHQDFMATPIARTCASTCSNRRLRRCGHARASWRGAARPASTPSRARSRGAAVREPAGGHPRHPTLSG